MMRAKMTTVLVGLLATVAQGSTINVPGDQPSIQAGINAAAPGDTVLVAAGFYYEHEIDFQGKQIAVKSVRGAGETVVDARGLGRGFVFQNLESNQSILDGFTVRGGNAPVVGGGVYILNAAPTVRNCRLVDNHANVAGGGLSIDLGDALIQDCQIEANTCGDSAGPAGFGGGIFIRHSSPLIQRCQIRGNWIVGLAILDSIQGYGGGVCLEGGDPRFVDCEISGNRAADGHPNPNFDYVPGGSGGGVYVDIGNLTLESCLIEGNKAGDTNMDGVGNIPGGSGGGVANFFGSVTMTNCIFSRNVAGNGNHNVPTAGHGGQGGALYSFPGAFTMTNCVVTDNYSGLSGELNPAYADGGGVSGTGTIRNSIVWGNTPNALTGSLTVTYTDVQGGFAGVGNIDVDPLLLPSFHLASGSPCRDTGDPNVVGLPSTDFEGDARVVGPRVDMGADEIAPQRPQ